MQSNGRKQLASHKTHNGNNRKPQQITISNSRHAFLRMNPKDNTDENISCGEAGDDIANKNNNDPSATHSGDSSPDCDVRKPALIYEPENGRWSCWCSRLIFYWLMALIVAALILLVSYNLFNFVNENDKCIDQDSSQKPHRHLLEQNKYKLFSTKTAYKHALDELERSRTGSSRALKSLFKGNVDSLPAIVARLTKDNCKVTQFHYFGRHATRWPSEDDLAKMSEYIAQVQARIDLLKLGQVSNKNRQQPPNQTQQQNRVNYIATDNKSSSSPMASKQSTCYDPLVAYKQWQLADSFGSKAISNLITRTGVEETNNIALRFKKLFPNLFNASKTAAIDFGVTKELRTAQTALIFMKNIDSYNSETCKLDDFPSIDLSNTNTSLSKDMEITSSVPSNDCFRRLSSKYVKSNMLSFHKECKQRSNGRKRETIPLDYKLRIKDPSRTEHIAKSVSKKLKLAEKDHLNSNQTKAIYDACRYETAITGDSSVWCSLFSEDDLKFYEYLADVDDYFNSAYGYEGLSKSACIISNSLYKSFKGSNITSKFYFTHSEVIQRLIALSTSLDDDGPSYSPEVVRNNLDSKSVPKDRDWRTSLLTPFAANIAFSVFKCPKQDQMGADQEEKSGVKIVASLNEQPIVLKGCAEAICDFEEARDYSRLLRDKTCTLDNACEPNEYIIT